MILRQLRLHRPRIVFWTAPSQGPYPMYGMAMNGRLLESGNWPEDNYCYPNPAYGAVPSQLPTRHLRVKRISNCSVLQLQPRNNSKETRTRR